MSVFKHIHPFPARMAPEIALAACAKAHAGAVVLDPMCGSGTVIRTAVEQGLDAYGFDLDPLAVLISKVFATPLYGDGFLERAQAITYKARRICDTDVTLANIDEDESTKAFVDYWFASPQREQLRRLSWLIARDRSPFRWALKVALSRIIVTKEPQCSLARDTSHSRPHRVKLTNDFDVFLGFIQSAKKLAKLHCHEQVKGSAVVRRGDARLLTGIASGTIDLVITSPPYLNAIDYMRGHKLALVWLGYSLHQLRGIRSSSVGTERGYAGAASQRLQALASAGCDLKLLSSREKAMVLRYSADVELFTKRCVRVIKPGGEAVYVVGNSCLKGRFIRNADIVSAAAVAAGLELREAIERPLPANRRYLPPPSGTDSSLEKRMRTEAVMTFAKPTGA